MLLNRKAAAILGRPEREARLHGLIVVAQHKAANTRGMKRMRFLGHARKFKRMAYDEARRLELPVA